MIRIELVNLGFTLHCDHYFSVVTPASHGGYVYNPGRIRLTLIFNNKQHSKELIRKIAISGIIIEEMLVYEVEGEPPTSFGYVIVDKTENGIGGEFVAHMEALRTNLHDPNHYKNRKCSCGNMIHRDYVMSLIQLKLGIDYICFKEIWDNDLFRFMCCECFKKQNKDDGKLPEYTGEYITVRWSDSPPPGTRIRGSRCPPE